MPLLAMAALLASCVQQTLEDPQPEEIMAVAELPESEDGFETTKCHSYRVKKLKSKRKLQKSCERKSTCHVIILRVKLKCILLEIQDHEFLNIGHQPLSISF